MKNLLFLFLFLCSINLFSQDIVYDTINGNRDLWMKTYGGPDRILLKTHYENLGMLTKSKILVAAGDLEGLTAKVDYQDYYYNYDTISTEFHTDTVLNMILYKYYHTPTAFYNYVGFRKQGFSDDVFEGKYVYICPLYKLESTINVYNGIGPSKTLYRSFRLSDITDASYSNWNLSQNITIEIIYLTHWARFARVDKYITDIEENIFDKIIVYPNPTQGNLNISIPNEENKTYIIRIYSLDVSLLYEGFMTSSLMNINISTFKPGSYYILVFDEYENFIKPINIIKI